MVPLVKPSRIFHAVCAYWLTSREGSNAKAPALDASRRARQKVALVCAFPIPGTYLNPAGIPWTRRVANKVTIAMAPQVYYWCLLQASATRRFCYDGQSFKFMCLGARIPPADKGVTEWIEKRSRI